MTTILEVRGLVQWWLYTIGHGQLLLRRAKSAELPRRVDILFKDVTEVHMLSHFDNLRLLELRSEGAESKRRFRLIGDNGVGEVIAGVVMHAEDDLEYNAPSPLMP
jgi:hypothetical protein